MRRWGWLLLLALFAAGAFAAGPRAARKQVEASMQVTGRITIERNGSVSGWTLDEREKLPGGVSRLVDKAVPQFRFEPVLVEGKPTRGTARMSLVVTAKPAGDGEFEVSIRDGRFGREAFSPEERDASGLAAEYVTSEQMKPPPYPMRALEMNAQGTVYLALRVNRQGTVDDVVVEQVNLRTIGSEREMQQMRDMLAKPALAAARAWTFRAPTAGEWVDDDSWTLRVPVDFFISEHRRDVRQAGYGEWNSYVPGPRMPIPWDVDAAEASLSPDTLIAGEVHQEGTTMKLLTPLGGG